MKRTDVYKLIDGERDYQDEKWNENTTETNGHHYTPEEWIIYMEDYLAEAKHSLSREAKPMSYNKAMDCIRKVTALGVAAMEHIETPPRKKQ
jgi:5-bromo-4-chloroindolyl phosphate hydrolysis protein